MNQCGAIDGVFAVIAGIMMPPGHVDCASLHKGIELRIFILKLHCSMAWIFRKVRAFLAMVSQVTYTQDSGIGILAGAMWQGPWVNRVNGKTLSVPHL